MKKVRFYVLSLLILVIVVVWPLSYGVWIRSPDLHYRGRWCGGIQNGQWWVVRELYDEFELDKYKSPADDVKWKLLGFEYLHGIGLWSIMGVSPGNGVWRRMGEPIYSITVPSWFLASILLPFGIRGWLDCRREWVAKHRKLQGICVGCGYDLRAHHVGEKCPECGRVIEGKILE